jgi:RNA:NAD 2'-phosphotransferase (TPT1/KptA family)
MTKLEAASASLKEWAPDLEAELTLMGYLTAARREDDWMTAYTGEFDLSLIVTASGTEHAIEAWHAVLKERSRLPTPVLILILEHMRRNPGVSAAATRRLRLKFAPTLANVGYRAADALHDDARHSYSGAEIDGAVSRFRRLLAEMRFAIDSGLLSEPTRRLATGKYATAAAIVGRWIDLPASTLSRALLFSEQSMALGNVHRETISYRLELLVQHFDMTGDARSLHAARELTRAHPDMAGDSEVAQAEVRLRLSLIAGTPEADANVYLQVARKLTVSSRPRNSADEARKSVLETLIELAKGQRLPLRARELALPRGLLTAMATRPSADLWAAIRLIVTRLDELRDASKSVPAAALCTQLVRQIVEGPPELVESGDIDRYIDVTAWVAGRASWNRHLEWEAGRAALVGAAVNANPDLGDRAKRRFEALIQRHPRWPLPYAGMARTIELQAHRDQSRAESLWREAAALALAAPTYARSQLGGRNEVFAFADVRGFMSETFVFKRTTKANAEHEAVMLMVLKAEVERRGMTARFGVPQSLAIVELDSADERRWVHVSQRVAGQLVSEMPVEQVADRLPHIVDLLSVFHAIGGAPPQGKSAWRSMKGLLKLWARTLLEPHQAENLVARMRDAFPSELPLVRKRDGHASNWIVDPAGRIIAIDLESSEFVPVGLDLAQLIEDNALLPATLEHWESRLALMRRYLSGVDVSLTEVDLSEAYGWFALSRALRLGTEQQSGKSLKRHARELVALLQHVGAPSIRVLASDLLLALSRVESSNDQVEHQPSHDHRRLSRSMAYMLRHHGPEFDVPIDADGFASMDDLSAALSVDTSDLLAVALHPGEPRFEVQEDRIRALYGHSLDVEVHSDLDLGTPATLYHGSSWSNLEQVLEDGLVPMSRQMVHLTNVEQEALVVGQRKGPAIVFCLDNTVDAEPVAEGIWVARRVGVNHLRIQNPYRFESGVSA